MHFKLYLSSAGIHLKMPDDHLHAPQTFLFNITADPAERNDLSSSNPDVVKALMKRLEDYKKGAVPCRFPDPDPQANPNLPGRSGVWEPWMADNKD